MRLILLLFVATTALGDYALRGTLVTPDQVIENGVLLVRSDGKIAAASSSVVIPANVPVIDTDGFIYPGLIDLHNHLTWNAHPRWTPPRLTSTRYEWQEMPEYKSELNGPHYAVPKENSCDLERYGEVKALVWGATSVTGGLTTECVRGLARNLDAADFTKEPLVQYRIFPLELGADDEMSVRNALKSGTPVIVHLGEGIDASARREARMANAHGYLVPGFVAIHAVGLGESDFELLGKNGVGMVWSPRSNIELYGKTANVAAAKKHVTMAIAPDWSPSGSSGMIAELRYAAQKVPGVFTSRELVQMATSNPARLARVADRLGRLEPGMLADYVVVKRGNRDAYESLIHAEVADVVAVAVNGRPLFGDAKLMTAIHPAAKLEAVTICGVAKALDMSDSTASFATTKTTLEKVLSGKLAGLAEAADCPP